MGILKVENRFGEMWFEVTVISLASITCDRKTEMLTLAMHLKYYLKVFENVKYFMKVFKYK